MSVQLRVDATRSQLLQENLLNVRLVNQGGHISINVPDEETQIRVSQERSILHFTINGPHGSDRISMDTLKTKSVRVRVKNDHNTIVVDPSVIFPVTFEKEAGVEKSLSPPIESSTYDQFLKVLNGNETTCIPLETDGTIPPPDPASSTRSSSSLRLTDSEEELRRLWQRVANESNDRSNMENSRSQASQEAGRIRRLELLLQVVLKGGNIDLAILLLSGLETHEANRISAGLVGRIQELQKQRRDLADQMGQLGKSAEDASKMSALNLQAGDMATEISLLQTFLQDVSSQKGEAEQLASNFLKSRHDTAMGIIRNVG